MLANFSAVAAFAIIPADSQLDGSDINVIFYSPATERVGLPFRYRYNLINPLGYCIITGELCSIVSAADTIKALALGNKAKGTTVL